MSGYERDQLRGWSHRVVPSGRAEWKSVPDEMLTRLRKTFANALRALGYDETLWGGRELQVLVGGGQLMFEFGDDRSVGEWDGDADDLDALVEDFASIHWGPSDSD